MYTKRTRVGVGGGGGGGCVHYVMYSNRKTRNALKRPPVILLVTRVSPPSLLIHDYTEMHLSRTTAVK